MLPIFFDRMIRDLNELSSDADAGAEDSVESSHSENMRAALLAIKELLGELNVLSQCGLKKMITADGRVMWILDDQDVIRDFEETGGRPMDFFGRTPDEIFLEIKGKYSPNSRAIVGSNNNPSSEVASSPDIEDKQRTRGNRSNSTFSRFSRSKSASSKPLKGIVHTTDVSNLGSSMDEEAEVQTSRKGANTNRSLAKIFKSGLRKLK